MAYIGCRPPENLSCDQILAIGLRARRQTAEGERDPARGVNIRIVAEEPRMTVFGAVVGELMLERDIRSWTDLSKLLEDHGHGFEPSRVSGWAYVARKRVVSGQRV